MISPPFRYYGGKGRSAEWIVSLLPEHGAYIEPFFGAGAVFFRKPQSRHELINDVDGMVVNFYRVLRNDLDALVDACRMTPYARDEFNDCKLSYDDTEADDIERARRFYTVVSQSFACTTSTASGWGASMSKNVNRPKSTQRYVERFHLVADRLREVSIENKDAIQVIEQFGRSDALVYCDPPYVHASRGEGASMGGHGYRHEMTDDNHRHLAECLKNSPATVLLSGYHSDLYRDLYDGWHVSERAAYSTVSGISGGGTERTEVIWSNKPMMQGRLFS